MSKLDLQGFLKASRRRGIPDNIIIQVLKDSGFNRESEIVAKTSFQGKIPDISSRTLETQIPGISRVGRFIGAEQLGRGLGSRLASLTPQFQESVRTAEEQGVLTPEQRRSLETGGISRRELIGRGIQVAGAGLTPFAGKILPVMRTLAPSKSFLGKIAPSKLTRELAGVAGTEQFGRGIAEDKTVKDSLVKAAQSAVIVTAAGPVLKGIGKGMRATSNLIAETFGGTPQRAIDFMIQNPKIGTRAINEAVKNENKIFDIAAAGQKAVDNIQVNRDKLFRTQLAEINKKFGKKQISMNPFLEKARRSLTEKFKFFTPRGKFNPQGVITDRKEVNEIQGVLDRIAEQKDRSADGILTLRRFIKGKISGSRSNEFNSVMTALSNDMKSTLIADKKIGKDVSKLLDKFRTTSTLLALIKKEFGLVARQSGIEIGEEGGQVLIHENTKRVINAMRRIVKDNNEVGRLLFEELERMGGKKMTADIMAQFFKSFTPPGGFQKVLGLGVGSVVAFVAGLQKLFGVAPLALFASPRVVGRTATLEGKIGRTLGSVGTKPITRTLGTVGTAAKQAARQLLVEKF